MLSRQDIRRTSDFPETTPKRVMERARNKRSSKPNSFSKGNWIKFYPHIHPAQNQMNFSTQVCQFCILTIWGMVPKLSLPASHLIQETVSPLHAIACRAEALWMKNRNGTIIEQKTVTICSKTLTDPDRGTKGQHELVVKQVLPAMILSTQFAIQIMCSNYL